MGSQRRKTTLENHGQRHYRRDEARDKLRTEWTVTSADIQFQKRLMYDLDLGPHISARGRILFSGVRAPVRAKSMDGNGEDPKDAILAVGGRGIYPVDVIMEANIEDLSPCDPFQAPIVKLSIDLETSISSNRILCAAVVVERTETGKSTLSMATKSRTS